MSKEDRGRAVYEARWACWKACCGHVKPGKDCQNRELHEAIRDLDLEWLKHHRACCAESADSEEKP